MLLMKIGAWDNLLEEWVAESQGVAGQGGPGGQGCQGGQAGQGGQGCQVCKEELVTHGCNSLHVGHT